MTAQANKNGSKFEELTSVKPTLLNKGFIHKFSTDKLEYFEKMIGETKMVFVEQGNFIKYVKNYLPDKLNGKYGFVFKPDEAFIINDSKIIILEKKSQRREGSVDCKLWAAIGYKQSFELIFPTCSIEYHFVVNEWLKNKFRTNPKFQLLKDILAKNNTRVFYGEDRTYFKQLQTHVGFGN